MSTATIDDGSCLVEDECGVCGGAGIPAGQCDCFGNVEDVCGECGGSGFLGCTDSGACNYDAGACGDDGSCLFVDECESAEDPAFQQETVIVMATCWMNVECAEAMAFPKVLAIVMETPGCTDPLAQNYNALACDDNGSCIILVVQTQP